MDINKLFQKITVFFMVLIFIMGHAQTFYAISFEENNTQVYTSDTTTTSGSALVTSLTTGELGTKTNPYLIGTRTELEDISKNLNAYYKLTADIDLENQEWTPIGNYQKIFKGGLDGNGFKIKNLTIKESKETTIGLFGYANGATFENIIIENVDIEITASTTVGALAGIIFKSKVDKCAVTGEGLIRLIWGNNVAGGLLGTATDSSEINRSFSTIKLIGTSTIGSFIGTLQDSFVKDCFSNLIEDGNPYTVHGFVDWGYYATIENCYYVGQISTSKNKGIANFNNGTPIINSYFDSTLSNLKTPLESAKTTPEMMSKSTFVGWDFDTVWDINENSSYPSLRGFGNSPDNINDAKITFNTQNLKETKNNKDIFYTTDKIDEISGSYSGNNTLSKLFIKIHSNNLIIDEFEIEASNNWKILNPKLILGANTITILAKDVKGNFIEESIFVVNYSKDNSANITLDTKDDDDDKLENYKEVIYGTNPLSADTDNDGVSDYLEIFYTFTDPLVKDENISVDIDSDTISNEDELKLGTSPVNEDSDFDHIPDNTEVSDGTDPLKYDTDGDGLLDGVEKVLETNPLVVDTDNSFKINVDTINGNNDDKVKTFVKYDISKDDIINNKFYSVTVQKLEDEKILTNSIPGYLSDPVEVKPQSDLLNTVLFFEYDSSLNNYEGFNPRIYFFNEKDQIVEEVESQTINGNTLSINVNQNGKYLLLDKTKYELIKNSVAPKVKIQPFSLEKSEISTNKNVIIVLDRNYNSMLTTAKVAAIFLNKNIKEDYNIMIATVHLSGFVKLTDFTKDRDTTKNAIVSVEYDNDDTSFTGNTLFRSLNNMLTGPEKIDLDSNFKTEIILFTGKQTIYPNKDAKASFSVNEIGYDNLTNFAIENDIPISVIEYKNLDGDPNPALERLTLTTGSNMHKIVPYNFKIDKLQLMAKEVSDYINKVSSTADYDSDGLNDEQEELLNSGKALDTLYQPIKLIKPDLLSYSNPDSDSDNLKDGEEIVYLPDLGVFKFNSDPTWGDTDGDGYGDAKDPYPRKPLKLIKTLNNEMKNAGQVFEITNSFEDVPSSIAVETAKEAKRRDSFELPEYDNIIAYFKAANFSGLRTLETLDFFNSNHYPNISHLSKDEKEKVIIYSADWEIFSVGGIAISVLVPNATEALRAYLTNKDYDYIKDLNIRNLINSSPLARQSFEDNVQIAMQYVEYNLENENDTLNFTTKKDFDGYVYGQRSPDFSNNTELETLEFFIGSEDWILTLGSAQAMVSASAKKISDNKYSMKFRYNIADFYDFTEGDGAFDKIITATDLSRLYDTGLASPYIRSKEEGYIEFEFSWYEGQVYVYTSHINIIL